MPVRIGIAGLGTVGTATLRLLQNHAEFAKVVAVSARDQNKARQLSLAGICWANDAVALAQDPDIDLFIELIGGSDGVAAEAVKTALQNGKHVVTANKALLAKHGIELAQLAEQQKAILRGEASVGGAIPILQALRTGYAANRINRVAGILNGTCNYILTEMASGGRAFATVLHHAQQLGYAESDPSFDVDGIDTAHKLTILALQALGVAVPFDAIPIMGIRQISSEDLHYAHEFGYTIKLLGVAERIEQAITLRVAPHLVPQTHLLSQVHGVLNGVAVDGDYLGTGLLIGRGAGGEATASAVVSDVLAIAKGDRLPFFGIPATQLSSAANNADTKLIPYYLRCDLRDAVGTMAQLTRILTEHHLSIDALQMPPHKAGGTAPIILTLQPASETSVHTALAAIKIELPGLIGTPLCLPIFIS